MNPYQQLPEKAFWKPAVANRHFNDIVELWDPKFRIKPSHKVATYGSCFAQHIGRALKSRGYKWLVTEEAPFGLSDDNAKKFNYGIFSSRTGNIYTCSLLLQWVRWAFGEEEVPDEVWEQEGRFYDPFRPNIEPNGFESQEELLRSRKYCLECFKKSIIKSNFFVFTLGLTESWKHREKGYEYPMCPGTIAGEFNEDIHEFENQRFPQIRKSLLQAIKLMREHNPKLSFILTVSPVPLTATRSDNHVLVATMHSKSILRAVAGDIAATKSVADYFPSYEIINSPAFRGSFFEPNLRQVNPLGVTTVMNQFFACQAQKFGEAKTGDSGKKVSIDVGDVERDEVCEEELLSAFGEKK